MARIESATGYSKNNLPYLKMGNAPRTLVIFDGFNFDHRPLSGMAASMAAGNYGIFTESFTVYVATRKPNLPEGYSIQEMASDYAVMIREEMEPPVDIMGLSTGGTIAQYFAADYPDLVRRLVLASTGHRLSDIGKPIQRKLAVYARERKWRTFSATLAGAMFSGVARPVMMSLFWLMGNMMFASSANPDDGIVEIEAEDRHDFTELLAGIKVPTLVIGGELDKFYPIREMADGIPGARVIIYKNTGHAALAKRKYREDILAFLTEETV